MSIEQQDNNILIYDESGKIILDYSEGEKEYRNRLGLEEIPELVLPEEEVESEPFPGTEEKK